MNPTQTRLALRTAVAAARAAGALMRRNWRAPKTIHATTQHDIKLELDVRCQRLIERGLRRVFPDHAILGEEGVAGDPKAPTRWVIDPIDGTVNYTYGIPHACVSIALQERRRGRRAGGGAGEEYTTVVGVVLDPFCGELWTAVRGGPARLNGRVTRVSKRARLAEAVVSLGFGKEARALDPMLPVFQKLIRRVRKVRMMGAAALGLCYVASGRFDAYAEHQLRLWDIAAGGLIVECAGGEFWRRPTSGEHGYRIVASNGRLRRRAFEPPA